MYENRFAKINLYYESIENFKSNYILLEKETSNFCIDILKIIKTIDLKSNPELIEFVSLIRTRCSKYNEDVNHLYKKISSIENTNFEIIILENQIAARQ